MLLIIVIKIGIHFNRRNFLIFISCRARKWMETVSKCNAAISGDNSTEANFMELTIVSDVKFK